MTVSGSPNRPLQSADVLDNRERPRLSGNVRAKMIPAGYMAKHIATRPEWLKAERVTDIYSVSNCVSNDFADYINYWKHNRFWFFDSPERIQAVAKEHSLDLTNTRLFYYEVNETDIASFLHFNKLRKC